MKWTTKLNKFKAEYQEDESGNILQRGGGVQPKACQNCSFIFDVKPTLKPKERKVQNYTCGDCDFENIGVNVALEHKMLNSDHKIIIKEETKIIGYNKIIEGNVPVIKKIENDVIIICSDCNDNSNKSKNKHSS
jgi:hypothetical protein